MVLRPAFPGLADLNVAKNCDSHVGNEDNAQSAHIQGAKSHSRGSLHTVFPPCGSLICELQSNVMKNLKIIFAALALLMIATSAFTDKNMEAAIGQKAPALVLANDSTSVALDHFKGQWVILSFWSASDAHSRIASRSLLSMANDTTHTKGDADVTFISVNLDRSEQLMHEIMKIDGIDTDSSATFHLNPADDNTEQICRSWAMTKGLRTFVINPKGEIEAVDPTEGSLRALLAAV